MPASSETAATIAGPPYEDIAFRIVDREWDYSAKKERGFRSSFDKVRGRHFPITRFAALSWSCPAWSGLI
ncbi:hypothetical protein EWS82_13275 [Staphylococcus xylosus]|nr:hypothetical protein [Staphylococcus xylosus]